MNPTIRVASKLRTMKRFGDFKAGEWFVGPGNLAAAIKVNRYDFVYKDRQYSANATWPEGHDKLLIDPTSVEITITI